MNKAEKDYRIWKNENFIIESKIKLPIWNETLINDFYEKLNMVLSEIYERTDLNSNELKSLISISFSDDEKVLKLNNCFRKRKKATNVLSFPSHHIFNKKLFLGDIIFSIETIQKEANRDNKKVSDHLIHLFIHAVLHLLGYDHETEEQAKKMEDLEIKMLGNLKIDNPYR